MPTASALSAPVAPASAGAGSGSAAPGVLTADTRLFSSKVADILQDTGIDGRAAKVISAPMHALAQVQMVDAQAAAPASDTASNTNPDAPHGSLNDNQNDALATPVEADVPVEGDAEPFVFMAPTPNQLIAPPSQAEAASAAAESRAVPARPTPQQIAAITSDVANDAQPTAEKAAAVGALTLPADLLAASADQTEIVPPAIAKAALKAAQESGADQMAATNDEASSSDHKAADTLVAALKGDPAPPRPLRHSDASAPSNAAVADASPVKDENPNIQKTTLADAAPSSSAARPPAADSTQPAAPVQTTAPSVQPAAPAALAPQPMQRAAAVEHSLTFSRLSQATIETTAHLAAQIARSLDGKSTRFDMVLTPEDLGRVDVSLEIGDDGQLAARLAFDNPAAAAELRGRADELRKQLQDAGFQMAGDALDFSHRDQPQGGDAFERQQQRNALFGGGSRLALSADASPSILTSGVWTNLSLTPDRVDMKV
nr:flagellar hook-length control protein FliK [uncultured Brevundimonas sp.]